MKDIQDYWAAQKNYAIALRDKMLAEEDLLNTGLPRSHRTIESVPWFSGEYEKVRTEATSLSLWAAKEIGASCGG